MSQSPTIRLDKYLADAGEWSRKQAKALIKGGGVSVDGQAVKDEGFKVNPGQRVAVNGRTLGYRKHIYLMMNKPAGVVSASEGERRAGETVLDLLDPRYRNKGLFPAGRLDKDTTGLLIITNDGAFAHNTLSPKRHVEKVYEAIVDGELCAEDAAAFAGGLEIGGVGEHDAKERCLPAKLEILRAGKESAALVTIHEGKFHQIKRMFEARGKRVTALKRLSFGGIALDAELNEGEYRELNDEETEWVKKYGGD